MWWGQVQKQEQEAQRRHEYEQHMSNQTPTTTTSRKQGHLTHEERRDAYFNNMQPQNDDTDQDKAKSLADKGEMSPLEVSAYL